MLYPELADDDVMYTAVNILPGICLIMPVHTETQMLNKSHKFIESILYSKTVITSDGTIQP